MYDEGTATDVICYVSRNRCHETPYRPHRPHWPMVFPLWKQTAIYFSQYTNKNSYV